MARQVVRFLRQGRGLVAELLTKVRVRIHLTPDSAGNIQCAIGQLRGMGKLGLEVTPTKVIWPSARHMVTPERVRN